MPPDLGESVISLEDRLYVALCKRGDRGILELISFPATLLDGHGYEDEDERFVTAIECEVAS